MCKGSWRAPWIKAALQDSTVPPRLDQHRTLLNPAMEHLVSTQWLADALGAADFIIIDSSSHLPAAGRDAAAEFKQRHIPGAQFFNLSGLVDETSPVPGAHPRPDQLAERLASLGVTPDSRIVFYDDSAVRTAARGWFLARAHGLKNVAVLDGGLSKWVAEGRPVESGEAVAKPAPAFTLPAPKGMRYKHELLANVESAAEQMLDARDAARFTGEIEDAVHDLPGGHIPGACNLHFARLFNEDGTYKSPEGLRAEFTAAGIDIDQPVITSCGSGVTGCVLLLGLELAGAREMSLYDGSWVDWGSDPETPKHKGQSLKGTPA